MDPQTLTLLIYNISLLPIVFFSVLFLLLCLLNLFMEREEEAEWNLDEMETVPFVTVQLPSYNDPIAARCAQKCLEFDYPEDRYEIVIADDSTDESTQALLKGMADGRRVKYIHRTNRDGFKAGALKNAMPLCKGEIIVIFDADWIPARDVLRQMVEPFANPKVAIVQTRQGFYNHETNLITRFAAYLLMVYHSIIMPINNRISCVFFCGTAGAFRRSMFEEVGGWNLTSLTEDSDLSVRLLLRGYRSVYLPISTPSEVPYTFEGFVKQQMRWCYGNTRVFFDYYPRILFGSGLSIAQRLMILFITLGNIAAPFVLFMTFFGMMGWFLGDPSLFSFADLYVFVVRVIITGGYLLMGAYALLKQKRLKEYPHFLAATLTMGIILAGANAFAFIRAAGNWGLHWHCTPKEENSQFV